LKSAINQFQKQHTELLFQLRFFSFS